LSPAKIEERGRVLLEAVQLAGRCNVKVGTFSGGMKRRLNLVAALLHEPDLLFCDEPTVGVDPHSRNAIFTFLEELNSKGMTVIYTTHYMEEVQRLCNRIAIIDYGEIVAQGTLSELMNLLPYDEELLISPEAPTEPLEPLYAEFGQPRILSDGTSILTLGADFRLSRFFSEVENRGLEYRHFRLKQPSLEELFLHLTGHTLRD
jgi:ABC-2 type transport system ATP-binding protein